ncbi:hypothetical protein NQ317_013593 [Molorchus minor]|uniref:Uncharacterized protein n=1 Tax=Molorchus minor TaxID=1323400 RepID=A0ABQ9J6T5_9CUCU|nr:hypothetical protein NQ317_013593 [Molorchus minor]
MFKGVSCTSNGCLNKAIHWTSIKHRLIDVHESKEASRRPTFTEYPPRFALPHCPRFTKNIKVQNVLRFSINSRQSVFNTVYSVRCLSCLRVKGSFQEAAHNISINSHKNTEDGMKRWLRRAKKDYTKWHILVDHSV